MSGSATVLKKEYLLPVDKSRRAALEPHPGIYNVVGRGVLPLSTLLALAGKRALPLPPQLLYRLASYPARGQTGDLPAGFFDYLRYLWVADGERGWQAFGEPVYSTKEAWIAFVSSRRMRRSPVGSGGYSSAGSTCARVHAITG